MKCFKNIVLIASLSVMSITQTNAESESKTKNGATCSRYLVTASLLNIRKQPGLTSNIIGGLPKGKSVCVSDTSGNWSKIDEGWISSKYLTVDPKIAGTAKNEEAIEVSEVVDAGEVATESDSHHTTDEIKEETKDPVEEQEESASEANASLPQEERKIEKETSTEEGMKEPEKTEEAVEAEAVSAEAKKTEELAVEKEDTATTDYLKQIRTQKGVRGTNDIYLFEGNGDKCEIMILEKSTILANTCKPAINEDGEKMLCTWNKKMCKTEAQILDEINK